MKFKNRDIFLRVLNNWVRDGSTITGFSTGPYLEEVTLTGRDGCTENLVLFLDEEHYNNDSTYQPWSE